MAGKFLTLEEAALRLGVAVEEVNRLVDRKELFPMRDGTTIKFKVDEIERVATDLAAGGSGMNSDLGLDLDLAAGGPDDGSGADDLFFTDQVDDDSIFGDESGGIAQGPKTSIPVGNAAPPSGTFDVEDLGLDSILAASSPQLQGAAGQPRPADDSGELDLDLGPAGPGDSGLALGSGTIELDLGDASAPGGAADSGGLEIDLSDIGAGSAGLSGPGLPGSGISGALDSGLSLEKDALAASGIDLDVGGAPSGLGSGADAFGSGLGGEAFDLGGDAAGLDDEGSVVVSPEESGDSSFFSAALDDASSTSFDGTSGGIPGTGPGFDDLDLTLEPAFNVWQVVGLVCCALLMFMGGLLVFDIVRTTQAPPGSPFSSFLVDGLASTFGW
jgi:excisionase family DNA binding protein